MMESIIDRLEILEGKLDKLLLYIRELEDENLKLKTQLEVVLLK